MKAIAALLSGGQARVAAGQDRAGMLLAVPAYWWLDRYVSSQLLRRERN